MVIEDVLNFPATNSQFVIIRDAKRVNLNHYGKPEPIISTVRLTSTTFEDNT